MIIRVQSRGLFLVLPASFMRRWKFVFVVVATVLLTLDSSDGAIGDTEEQCNQRYGTGTVTHFDQQAKTKSIRYEHTFTADVDVQLLDGRATWICYSGHYPNTMGESDIPRLLNEESQGHKWALVYSNGQIKHDWVRDDGIIASEYLDPNEVSNPKTFLAVSSPPKAKPKRSDPTFIEVLGQALLLGIVVGVGFYFVIKLILLGFDALTKVPPKQ